MSTVRAYINPFVPGGVVEATQRAHASKGAELYVEDRKGKVVDAFLRSLRSKEIVELEELHYLAPGRGRADKRRRVLDERLAAIEAKGCVVRETAPGIAAASMTRMALRAYEQIATSGRARRRDKEGRPAFDATKHEWDVMESVWQSRRYKNDDERLTAIRKRIGKSPGRTTLRNRFGSPHKAGE
jgi:hypothetical protein